MSDSALTKAKAASPATVNPRTTTYEFLGPVGAFLVTIGVPIASYALNIACSGAYDCYPSLTDVKLDAPLALQSLDWWKGLWDNEAAALYLGWYLFTVVAWAVLPGDEVEGKPLRTGDVKKYKINAFATLLLALGAVVGVIVRKGEGFFADWVYEKWIGLLSASLAMSIAQSVYVYAASFSGSKLLALGGNSGNFIYDFFIGRELNPSIGLFDIKSFNELRPGLILWLILNIGAACEQARLRGGLSEITDSMWLVLAFQGFYVADALFNEPAILTTMDITTDGFGFMLAVGDLTWVPFVYSLQARYLAFHPVELGPLTTASIFLVNLTGYLIFRGANGEKNDFRNGKNPKNLKYFTTKSGSKLLTSGWWGRSRHPNYMGDLLMAFAWSLPTQFDTPITYFYVSYFAVLLIHRQLRDDHQCELKYGEDWKKYKKLVPSRIIPYIY